MSQKETAIAYGIEFYVGRRSRDRALSDVRAAGEMVNLQAARNFKEGAAERERLHAEAVQGLRNNSEKALGDLATLRKKAASQAAQAFDAMKPLSPEDALASGKIDSSQLDDYEKKFSGQLRGMDGALKEFADSSGKLGLEFATTDTAGVMEGFAQADAQQRKAAIDDLDTRKQRRDEIIKSLEKENELSSKRLKEAKKWAAEKGGKEGQLKSEREKLALMKQGTEAYDKQQKLVRKLERQQTANNKVIEEQEEILKNNIEELEKQTNLKEGDKQLLRELKRLHSELTGEEIRTGKIVRDNKNKERELDKKKREDDVIAIQQMKEQNRLMQEYSRHIDEGAQKVGSTLKNAFVIGTAAITALNYKLMSVVSAFQEFETQVINAQSIWQTSNEQLFEISDSVVEFGTKYGVSMQNATQGLYQYASAGVQAAEAMEMLEHTLKLSMAVQGDHNTLSKLTTQTLMGFNMEFSQAEEVTDKFAHAINKSLIEWDDLASSVKFALPFFTSTGQSIDQLLGGLEVLTNRALEAGIAGRGLRQALAEFAQHADDNAAAFRKMGVEIMNTDGTMKQLTEIAQEFNAAMGDGATDMEVMITLMEDLNVRGATAFVHLAQNADEFEAAVSNLSNSQGESAKMAEIQQQSLANQIQVVKNAMMAPFILSDKIGEEAGYLNQFAMELHNIVDIVEGLFIQEMADGSIALTKMGEIIRDFVIGALHQAKDVLVILVKIIGDFAEQGHSMTGMLHAAAIPLKLVAKLAAFMGEGFFEAIIAYKVLNGLIPINSAVLAANIKMIMNAASAKATEMNTQVGLNQVSATGLAMTKASGKWKYVETQRTATAAVQKQMDAKMTEQQTMATGKLNTSMGALVKTQMMSKGIMMVAMFATQKIAKDSWVLAGVIGALAGAYMGYAIALQMVAAAKLEAEAGGTMVGVNMTRAMLWGAAAGAAFNIMMQQMMKPDQSTMPELSDVSTMDTGGRFMKRRMYDMGGYTQDHGMAILQKGETVIPKTQNMLGGGSDSGITLNIHGDVYDSDNFAQKISEVLPTAIRKTNDIGGI